MLSLGQHLPCEAFFSPAEYSNKSKYRQALSENRLHVRATV